MFPLGTFPNGCPNPPTGWLPRFNTNRRRFGILFTDTAVGYISLKGIQSVVEGSTEAELLTHFGSLFLWRQIFLLVVFFLGCFFFLLLLRFFFVGHFVLFVGHFVVVVVVVVVVAILWVFFPVWLLTSSKLQTVTFELWRQISPRHLSMHTLFRSVTGGVDWGDMANLLIYVNWIWGRLKRFSITWLKFYEAWILSVSAPSGSIKKMCFATH